MRPVDTNAPTSVRIDHGYCVVRFGSHVLAFADVVEAEAALDEACLALRLLTVGAGR